MLRFAANLSMMYNEYPFLQRFGAAARDGFKAVEYLFPYEYPAAQLASELRSNGLSQVLLNAPAGYWAEGERGLACLPGREVEFQDSFRRALAYAQVLECPRVHVMAGVTPQGADRQKHLAIYAGNLAWAAAEAEKTGREVLIEPINTRDMPGYLLNRQDEAQAIIAGIGRKNLKVQFDLYHCANVEGDVAGELRKALAGTREAKVGHMQIAGVPGRHEPDTGDLNFDPLLDLIEEQGFDGWIGLEYRPLAGTSEGLKWLRKRS